MSQTLILLWLAGAEALPAFRADLDSFAQAYLVDLAAPVANAPSLVGPAYAPNVVERVEFLLDTARIQASSLNESSARELLNEAEELLHAHPELPQASWLMAEGWQIAADIEEALAPGTDVARELRHRARALEGRRASAFGAASVDTSAPPDVRVSIQGLAPSDELEWNGVHHKQVLVAHPGEHHARVVRNGRLIWAGWVNVDENVREILLPIPEIAACSLDDLGSTRVVRQRLVPDQSTRCENWAVARPNPKGGVQIATCKRGSCGQFRIWRRRPQTSKALPVITPRVDSETGFVWPTWATYAVAGAGVLLTTGIVLWQTGAFDSEPPKRETVWTYRGIESAIRF